MQKREDTLLSEHPCFGDSAHFLYGRIHLPVAPRCNLRCLYCDRRYDCVNESRPGVTSEVLTPVQALKRAKDVFSSHPSMRVAGIAGPGEPLYNEETFETFSLIREEIPQAVLCVSSNGLAVAERIGDMKSAGIDTLTVTVNCLTADTASDIYDDVLEGCPGESVPERLGEFLEKQLRGIALAAEAGLAVKINTVLIPGINDGEIEGIAKKCSRLGACIMNVMPLIPCGRMADRRAPSGSELVAARRSAERYMKILRVCSQCRADACGIPGRDGGGCLPEGLDYRTKPRSS